MHFIDCFFFQAHEQGWGGADKEGGPQAGSAPSTEPDVGLDLKPCDHDLS